MPAKGEPRQGSRVSPLKQDGYVDRLRPNPTDAAPKVFELHGYLGRDNLANYWRIYLRNDLSCYIRVAEVDIVDFQRSDAPGTDLEPSRIFVSLSAELEWVSSGAVDTKTSFLQGQYTSSLSQPARNALALAVASNRQRSRQGSDQETGLEYPATPGFPCQPQVTIESNTCFCTIFSCTR
jgi:hypothetical protein